MTMIGVTGLVLWAGCLLLLPAPLAARITLLAPLVVVPRLLLLVDGRGSVARLGGWPAIAAAVALAAAFGLPPGLPAGVAALPWLVLGVTAAGSAVVHGLRGLPGILDPRRPADLGIDVALGLLGAGSAFLFCDRLGFRPLDFDATTILLTGTHFHFAGFGLLVIASRLASRVPWLGPAVLGLVIGTPGTALGFVVRSDEIAAIGALVVAISGIAAAVALLTVAHRVVPAGPARWAHRLAGLALLVGMPLAIAWALGTVTGSTFLGIDTMIRTHGALNASAVVLAALAIPDR